ncbi:MAG: hypothetical protein EBS89_14700 [Proteobacteria bacterium]|nr:hypothetical protein [Pseudomonadota bacterium]
MQRFAQAYALHIALKVVYRSGFTHFVLLQNFFTAHCHRYMKRMIPQQRRQTVTFAQRCQCGTRYLNRPNATYAVDIAYGDFFQRAECVVKCVTALVNLVCADRCNFVGVHDRYMRVYQILFNIRHIHYAGSWKFGTRRAYSIKDAAHKCVRYGQKKPAALREIESPSKRVVCRGLFVATI